MLNIIGLKTVFKINGKQTVKAVDRIDLLVEKGQIHGIVGESGCGKSVTALSILGLVPAPGRIVEGEVVWEGENLITLNSTSLRKIRGKGITMIFQEPQASLNPLFRVGHQLTSLLKKHQGMNQQEAKTEALRLLECVKIVAPEQRYYYYPHQLSGGMCQRVMIAMALACKPKLLIADEPTAALDVTIQKQILDLLLEIKDQYEMSILLISHDMGVVAYMCDMVSVMYLGKIVESAQTRTLFAKPLHPYTQVLLGSVLVPDPSHHYTVDVGGELPDQGFMHTGCRFYGRCCHALNICRTNEPQLNMVKTEGASVACWLYEN